MIKKIWKCFSMYSTILLFPTGVAVSVLFLALSFLVIARSSPVVTLQSTGECAIYRLICCHNLQFWSVWHKKRAPCASLWTFLKAVLLSPGFGERCVCVCVCVGGGGGGGDGGWGSECKHYFVANAKGAKLKGWVWKPSYQKNCLYCIFLAPEDKIKKNY